MLARVRSAVVIGVDAHPVDVEIDLANGLPSFTTVGLPQNAVKEGRERVTAAIANSGFEFPLRRITANLAPADVPKAGSAFDLPIAIGILIASEQVVLARPAIGAKSGFLFGELSLEGALRPVRGTLSLIMCARDLGARWAIVPAANAREASLVEGIDVFGAATLRDVVGHLVGSSPLDATVRVAELPATIDDVDFGDVKGQSLAKRALEIAAAGAHNVIMIGPPGGGKTMLARRLPSILPPLTLEESLEVGRIRSVAGLLSDGGAAAVRAFRAPHHTISDAGLVGGGPSARPGEVSLAHHGVLFLDELPEFRRNVLEALRQPLEDGVVAIARAAMTLAYPARFMLVAAMNPCPCGFLGDRRGNCSCGAETIAKYRGRISGPLLDRIDMQLIVGATSWQDLTDDRRGESSSAIRERVAGARRRQLERYRGRRGVFANAHLSARGVREFCQVDAAARTLLSAAVERLGLSARGYGRVLKLARTIADLAGVEGIEVGHIAEAIQYRGLDRAATGPD
jgi:magnesium chelatase family protein